MVKAAFLQLKLIVQFLLLYWTKLFCAYCVLVFVNMKLLTGLLSRLRASVVQEPTTAWQVVKSPLTLGKRRCQFGLYVQTRMAQVVQTCTLLVTGRLEEVLDPVLRAQKYPAVQLDGLTAVLTKFRFFTFLPSMLALASFYLCSHGQSGR